MKIFYGLEVKMKIILVLRFLETLTTMKYLCRFSKYEYWKVRTVQ